MLSFRRMAMVAAMAAAMMQAQPALTTIEDILYLADAVVVGTSFTFSTPFTIGSFTCAVAMFDVSPA